MCRLASDDYTRDAARRIRIERSALWACRRSARVSDIMRSSDKTLIRCTASIVALRESTPVSAQPLPSKNHQFSLLNRMASETRTCAPQCRWTARFQPTFCTSKLGCATM